MLNQLNNDDWAEVFGEGCEIDGNCPPIKPTQCPPNSDISRLTFGREDVEEISQIVEGERDKEDWVVFGRLKDGRWFVARGGCDYTGWGCQASNSGEVGRTKEDIIRYGLSDNERLRFGIKLEQS